MDQLADFLDEATRRPAHAGIMDLGAVLSKRQPGALAVLAYGSAQREQTPETTLIDYYVLVEGTRHLSHNPIARLLGYLVPPNVYYAEHRRDGETLRAKIAIMTLRRFASGMSAAALTPYFWARFTQPCRIIWVKDEAVRETVLVALSSAVRTSFGHAIALSPATPWRALFENTYRTELRPEDQSRAAQIVANDAAYYDQISALLSGTAPVEASWNALQIKGKLMSVARLAKAAFTFQGGADYAAWKIERHSGVKIEVTEWQRRHPFLAGLVLLPQLLRKKGLS
jgi:hypothetical protein